MNRTFVIRSETLMQAVTAFIQSNAMPMLQQGKPMAVTVTEAKSKRSLEQNARLHALLQEIANNAWVEGRQFDMETWKEFFRREYIGVEEYELPNGKRSERGISTTTLSVGDFADLMTKIEQYAADHLAVEFS